MISVCSAMFVQAVNDPGNLLSLTLFVATAVLALMIVFRRLRGRPTRPTAIAAVACLVLNGILLLAVSLASQTREIAPGTDKCFDDWCATVTGVQTFPGQQGTSEDKLAVVNFRVANRAKRATFRPSQPRVELIVPDGRVFMPSAAAQSEFERLAGPQKDLSSVVVAGEEFQTSLVFAVPRDTRKGSVIVLEGPATVTQFLIGDENSFFHKKIVFPISIE